MSTHDTATPHTHGTALTTEDRARYGRRAQLLAGASVAYNGIEAVIAIAAGLVAGSVALVGFGLDSIVEVSSGLIILWQFRHARPESRERTALRLMAVSFFALAAYVTFESLRALVSGNDPEPRQQGDPGDEMPDRQPEAGDDEPDHVAEGGPEPGRRLPDHGPPERPQRVRRDPERRDPERDRHDEDAADDPGDGVPDRHPDPAQQQPDDVQQEPHVPNLVAQL